MPREESCQDYRAELEAMDREIREIARASNLLSVVSGSSSPSDPYSVNYSVFNGPLCPECPI